MKAAFQRTDKWPLDQLLDAVSFHLSIEVGALNSKGFSRLRNIAFVLTQFFQNELSLVGLARTRERGKITELLNRLRSFFCQDSRKIGKLDHVLR